MGGSHHPVPPTTQDRQKCGARALRQAAELTQVGFARRMGVIQAAVSRMEQPRDLVLSTLNAYLAAIGGVRRFDHEPMSW